MSSWVIFHILKNANSFFWGVGCFSYPLSPPRSSIGLVLCVPFYTLSSPAFKGVTIRMSFKHTFPPLCYPWYMQVRPGAWSKPIIWETCKKMPIFLVCIFFNLTLSCCQWEILASKILWVVTHKVPQVCWKSNDELCYLLNGSTLICSQFQQGVILKMGGGVSGQSMIKLV